MTERTRPIGDPEVTLTFASVREARRFVERVQRVKSSRQKRVPFTKSVYRIAQKESR